LNAARRTVNENAEPGASVEVKRRESFSTGVRRFRRIAPSVRRTVEPNAPGIGLTGVRRLAKRVRNVKPGGLRKFCGARRRFFLISSFFS
jgi:hypothetical protein